MESTILSTLQAWQDHPQGWILWAALVAIFFNPGLIFLLTMIVVISEHDPVRHWPQIILASSAAVLAFGAFHNPLTGLVGASHAALARPFVTAARGLLQARGPLNTWMTDATDAMVTYGGQLRGRPAPLIFELSAVLVYFLLMLIVAAVDFYVGTLLFAALFGQTLGEGSIPINIESATGLLLATIFVSYGLVLFDIFGIAPNRLPWDILDERQKHWMKRAAAAGLVLTVGLSLAAQLWMQMQLAEVVPEPASTIAVYLFRALLALLLVFTTIMMGWAAIVIWGAVYVLVLLAAWLALHLGLLVLHLLVWQINALQFFAGAVLYVLAAPWMTLKTWLASYEALRRWGHFRAFQPRQLEETGLDIHTPLLTASSLVPSAPQPADELDRGSRQQAGDIDTEHLPVLSPSENGQHPSSHAA